MTKSSNAQQLIEASVDSISRAVQEIFSAQPQVPFTPHTDLLCLTPDEERLVRHAEEASYRARPTLSAINFCLTAASSLLSIVHSLLGPTGVAPAERARRWSQFAEDTKVAGRAAYRAALVLSDPASAHQGAKEIDQASPNASSDVQAQIAQRERVLEKSRLHRHWNRMKLEGITASEFIEFLRPLADLDGICVSFIYKSESGDERIYNHGKDSPRHNPMVEAIKKKELTLDAALGFALNEQGRIWVESNFIEP